MGIYLAFEILTIIISLLCFSAMKAKGQDTNEALARAILIVHLYMYGVAGIFALIIYLWAI